MARLGGWCSAHNRIACPLSHSRRRASGAKVARRYPSCDAHDHGGANVKTRALKMNSQSTIYLCRAGWTREMAWRRTRNKTLTGKAKFPVRAWPS